MREFKALTVQSDSFSHDHFEINKKSKQTISRFQESIHNFLTLSPRFPKVYQSKEQVIGFLQTLCEL